jgi:hypothetical protein
MAKQIKSEEIIERGALSEHIKQAETLIQLYDKWDEKLKEVAKESKKLVETLDTTNVKDLRKLAEEQQKVNKAFDQSTEIGKKKAKIDQQLQLLRSKEGQELEKRKIQLQEQRKQVKDQIRLNREQEGSIEQLRRKLSLVTNAWKSLSKEERENTKRGRRIVESKKKLTEELKRLEQATGDARRNVGNYSSALDGLGGKVRSVTGLLANFGVALGGGAAITGIFNLNKELAKAEQTARTLFNVSNEGARQLAENATKIAKVYGDDVNEVLRTANVLQEEFGLSEQASLDLIEQGYEKGLNASGELLNNTKEYATQLRLAGLDAEQTFSFIAETERRGVFSDKGIDAIKEATISLREMTPATQAALESIGLSADQIQKDINSGAKTYFDVIQEISAKTGEFGEQSQQAGMILADVFRGAGEDAGKFIFELGDLNTNFADVENTTTDFQQSVNNLTESWYDYIFGINDAGGLTQKLSGIIQFLANNLSTIINVITNLIGLYTIWIVRQKVINSGLIDYVKNTAKAVRSTKGLSKAQETASKGAKNFARSMRGIGWTALIGLGIELATVFYDIASGERAVREETKRLEKDIEDARNNANKVRSDTKKFLDEEADKLQKKIELMESEGKTQKEINEAKKQGLKEINELRENELKILEGNIKRAEFIASDVLEDLKAIGKSLEDLPKDEELAKIVSENIKEGRTSGVPAIISRSEEGLLTDILLANESLKIKKEIENEINESIFYQKVLTNDINRNIQASVNLRKEEKKTFEDIIKTQRELFERQIEGSGDEESIIRLDADKQIAELEEFQREYLRTKKEMFGKDATLNETELAQFKDLREQIEEELRQSLLKMNTEKRKEAIEVEKEIAENELTILENRMNAELSEVKGMDEKAVAERNAIRFKYMKQRAEIIGEITAKEIEAIDNEIAYWEESGKPLAEEKIEALEQEKEIAMQNARERGVQLQEEREEVQQTADAYQNMANTQQMINDAFRVYSDERIKMLDREIDKIDELVNASKNREQELSELRAKEGANVAESLAFEQEKQAEALARKQELERKKRRTELATAVVNLVSAKIEQGSTNPTGEAFTEIAAIQGFIQSLPQFWEGTDTTVGDKLGMKYSNERDGVIARIDPSEMVLNKDKVDSLRGMGVNTTDDIVNVAKMWKSSNAIQSSHDFGIVQTAKPQFDSKGIEKELTELKSKNSKMEGYLKELSSRPSHVFEGKMMNDYFDFIEKKISNNKEVKTYRRFR